MNRIVAVLLAVFGPDLAIADELPRQLERLDRGLVAIRHDSENVFLSWRWFATDVFKQKTFNLYQLDGEAVTKINEHPLSITSFTRKGPVADSVRFVVQPADHDEPPSATFATPIWRDYLEIPIRP